MGRATLIKSIALASPVYVMSAFKLPKSLCAELDAMVKKFWWNPKKEGSRLYTPMAWSDICKPLIDGGLGFRSFESFNETMIAKLAWWVLSNRDSFCVRVLRSKYKVGFNWLNEGSARSASYAWKGLKSVKDLLSRSACIKVESRNEILVWEDLWVPDLPNFNPQPREDLEVRQSMVVSQLMNRDKLWWDVGLLKNLFKEDTVQAILNIPRWQIHKSDS